MLTVLTWGLAHAAEPLPAALAEPLAVAVGACASGPTHALPEITAEHRQEMLEGEVVRILDRRRDGPSAAVGMAVLKAPVAQLWLAAMDPHAEVDPSLTEFVVEYPHDDDRALWYGYLDLPRPIKDRQWAVLATNNHAMAERTGHRCWEHAWALVDDELARVRPRIEAGHPSGITPDHLESAIFTPINMGSWYMAPLDGSHSFVAYQARTEVAGFIPDWLVTSLAMSRLERLLRNLERRGREWSPAHYTAGHEPVPGGDGRGLPTYGGAAPSSRAAVTGRNASH